MWYFLTCRGDTSFLTRTRLISIVLMFSYSILEAVLSYYKWIPWDIIQLYMMLICPSIPIFFDIPFLHQQMNSNKTRIMFSYEGIECACRHCGNELSEKRCQATTKESLAEHQRGIHEGVKYPCRQCGKQFSQKGALARPEFEKMFFFLSSRLIVSIFSAKFKKI